MRYAPLPQADPDAGAPLRWRENIRRAVVHHVGVNDGRTAISHLRTTVAVEGVVNAHAMGEAA